MRPERYRSEFGPFGVPNEARAWAAKVGGAGDAYLCSASAGLLDHDRAANLAASGTGCLISAGLQTCNLNRSH
jgi:hypothetical protein